MSDLLRVVKENLDCVSKMINPVTEQLSPRTPRSRTRKEGSRSKTVEPFEDPVHNVLANALAVLQTAVSNLAEVVKTNQDTSAAAAIAPQEEVAGKSRIRDVEDNLDEEKQKNLKGKFIISSSQTRKGKSFLRMMKL